MPTPADSCYRALNSANELLLAHFDDLDIVYAPSSGETYFLSELPHLVLQQFDGGPLSKSALLDRLGQIGGTQLEPEDVGKVESALTYLIEAELLEPCPPDSR